MSEKNNDFKQARLIETMLSEVESHLEQQGKPNDFIEDIRNKFTASGWLTEGQIEGLRKFYERI